LKSSPESDSAEFRVALLISESAGWLPPLVGCPLRRK
jgi:hypothetical protein